MIKVVTDYGMRTAFDAAQSPQVDPEKASIADKLLDSLLRSLPEDDPIHPDFALRLNGNIITAAEVLQSAAAQMPRMRLNAVQIFEEYFQKRPHIDSLLQDYQGGDESARRALRYMGIFPLEALSVRGELLHPKLMEMHARLDKDQQTGFVGIRRLLDDDTILEYTGPHLPPLPPNMVAVFFKEWAPYLDKRSRDFLAGHSSPPARSNNFN